MLMVHFRIMYRMHTFVTDWQTIKNKLVCQQRKSQGLFKVTIASEIVMTTFVLIFQEKILGSRLDQTVL